MTTPKATPKSNAMPYTGNKDADPKGKATPGAHKLLDIISSKWGFKNLGIYAYRRSALERFVKLPPSPLEVREKLEQLRALEAGMRIDVRIVETVPLGVDTPADLERARKLLDPRSKAAAAGRVRQSGGTGKTSMQVKKSVARKSAVGGIAGAGRKSSPSRRAQPSRKKSHT